MWWAASETARVGNLTNALVGKAVPGFSWLPGITSALVTWVPPVLVWIICVVLSHPVQEKLRGLHWTRKELVAQAAYSLGSALLPLIIAIKAIGGFARGDFRVAILLLFVALVVKLFALAKLQKIMGMQPQALTTGELRDAAFGMAQRLGVKLQQIYIIPAGKGQMANAFARKGNAIAFTDYLLQRMTRREVNYILGHELSHLRLKHIQKLSFAFLGSLAADIFLSQMLRASLADSYFLRYGLLFSVMSLGPYFWSRRFEYSADAGAVEATGDPQAAISALFKLASLNMHPMHWSKWSEKWLTHPSTLRRAQAIAKKAAIPLESLPEIARNALQDDAHYTIPPTALAGNKIHSSAKKGRTALSLALIMLSAMILTPTGFALLIKFNHFAAPIPGILYLLGALASAAAYLAVANFLPARKLGPLLAQLKTKVAGEGVQADAWNAVPVGLAPGPLPRSYEGHLHWDLGFLFLRSDRICYWGEEARFALRREQITGIKLGWAMPSLLRSLRIYIAWRDLERATCGVFSVGCAASTSMLSLRRRTRALYAQLLQWQSAPAQARSVPAPLDALTSPQFGAVTGVSPLATRKREKIVKEMYLYALLAAAVAVVAGLPFHLLQTIAQLSDVRKRHPFAIGSGWYVVAVTLGVILLQYVRYFFYKEIPVLTAIAAAATAPKPSSTAGIDQKDRQPEPVST
jgi:Zn-dependent protease with chaperone function